MKRICLFLLTLLSSCDSTQSLNNTSLYEIRGRETSAPLYRVEAPTSWKCQKLQAGFEDTTLPLCEFFIDDKVRIAIHNFPNDNLENRIPPNAQIARWKKQFKQLNPFSQHTQEDSWGGYNGLYFEAAGLLNGEETKMLAWSLQLAEEHFLNCVDHPSFKQALADFTIKVVGPKDLVERYQSEIEEFAHSFELIEELPQQT